MYRDFSETSKQNLLDLVTQVEDEKLSNFTDWIGDRWYDFEEWIGKLSLERYLDDINSYHKKVIDKNNTSKEAITEIFDAVEDVDSTYSGIFENLRAYLSTWNDYIISLSDIVAPENGNFSVEYMAGALNSILADIEQAYIDYLINQMVQEVDGELYFNEELIYEYLKKTPGELTDAEQAALLSVISQLKDTVAIYETLAYIGVDGLGADVLNYISWLSDSTKYDSFTAVSAHYNEIYLNLLNFIAEQSEDKSTFAASLVNIGIGESVLAILGYECSVSVGEIFGTGSFSAYLAKYETEHSEQYFLQLEASAKTTLSASGTLKSANKKLKDQLRDTGLRSERTDTAYFDKDGNVIGKKNEPTFYKRQITLAEVKGQVQARASIYQGSFDLGSFGEVDVIVGEAEAHAGISAGLYVIGADGEKKFSPGVKAEIGASVTALEVGWENQLLGDENFGINADATLTVAQASATSAITLQVFDDDGKLDLQASAGVKVEAIAAEVSGSVGVNVLGGEVGVSGSVNFGIGAHAEVGWSDGVFKIDIGASLGVGASISLDIDIGGMVDTVSDYASAAWEGIQEGWSTFISWF